MRRGKYLKLRLLNMKRPLSKTLFKVVEKIQNLQAQVQVQTAT
jgi:hypothetical protein